LVGLLAPIGRCEDASTPSPAARPPEMPAFDLSKPDDSSDKVMSASRAAVLSAKVNGMLEEGNVDESLAADREYVSALETAAGKDDWRTKNERLFLTELEQVVAFNDQRRTTYLDARRKMLDAGRKVAIAEYGEAETLLGEALAGFTAVLGENTNSVAFALQTLGRISLTQENPAKAREHFLRCQAVTKTLAGEDSTAYAAALNGLGCACLLAKDFDQAETHFQEALHRLRRLHGSKSPIYLDVLGRLCYVLVEKRRLPEAEAMCAQAFYLLQENRQQDSAYMATCLLNLANVNIAYEDYEDAEACLRRSLTIYEKISPTSNPEIARAVDRYAWLLRKLNRPDDAKVMEARGESIRQQNRSASRPRNDSPK
jgi:tetratricopeptide (TPR) repeat protein